MMKLRPFNINDAFTILSWCKDKHAFRLWSADRYKDYPWCVCDNLSAVECYKTVGFRITGEDAYGIDRKEWKEFEMELEKI